jgi:CHAT domain-containing protein
LSGKYLVETYTFSYLTTGRDVIRLGGKGPDVRGDYIVADPDFDCVPPSATAGAASPPAPPAEPGVQAAGMRFGPLPGTALEMARIAKVLGVPPERQLSSRLASKTSLRGIRSPRVLHIATHGYFLREEKAPPAASAPATGAATSMPSRTPRPLLDNPFLRSGLAMAGANHCAESSARGLSDNGMLTALEVCSLPLYGTDLVVLSACETGLGLQFRGEGVFGLRRAFLQAGARSLVMSLWKVPDLQTADLMEGFYTNWKGGQDKAHALRRAQLDMIASLRKSQGLAHPFYWAGFVLIGDWK